MRDKRQTRAPAPHRGWLSWRSSSAKRAHNTQRYGLHAPCMHTLRTARRVNAATLCSNPECGRSSTDMGVTRCMNPAFQASKDYHVHDLHKLGYRRIDETTECGLT